jgi:uncharacterized protein (TIGR03435 family)
MKKWMLVCLTACLGWGQAPPAFDVTTVRPSQSLEAGGGGSLRGGRLELRNASLKTLLSGAYEVKTYQIVGGPGWIGSAKFDIQGKTSTDIKWDAAWQMLQAMLADRFQVRLHRETRELPMYQLVVAKGGSRMKTVDKPGDFRVARGFIDSSGTTTKILADLVGGALDRPVLDRTGLVGQFVHQAQLGAG